MRYTYKIAVPIITITLTLISCNWANNDNILGKYIRSIDSSHHYSELILEHDHKYKFLSSSCFYLNKDSGTFIVNNDTIIFHSFDTNREERIKTNPSIQKSLTGEHFIIQKDKLIYIRRIKDHRHVLKNDNFNNSLNMLIDSLYWIKEVKI